MPLIEHREPRTVYTSEGASARLASDKGAQGVPARPSVEERVTAGGRNLSEACAILGVNLIWDATVKGTPSGMSYLTMGGETSDLSEDWRETISQVRAIRAVFPFAPVAVHAGYGN
jgi:hypothetical protein